MSEEVPHINLLPSPAVSPLIVVTPAGLDDDQATAFSSGADTPRIQGLTTFELLQVARPDNARRQMSKITEEVNDGCMRSAWSKMMRCVPRGVKENRLGIQWTIISAVSSILLYIPAPDSEFWKPVWTGFGVFICINAICSIEAARGATNRNVVMKFAGTTLAMVTALLVVVPLVLMGFHEYNNRITRWVMYYACVPSPFFWGFWLHHFPTFIHENFTYQGLSVHVYLFGSYSQRIVDDILIASCGCYIGTLIGFLGYQFILPVRARDILLDDVSTLTSNFAQVLEPLIDFESSTAIPGSASSGAKPAIVKRTLTRMASARRSTDAETGKLDTLQSFRDHVWTLLTESNTLMQRQEEMLKNAKREHYFRWPHYWSQEHYYPLLHDVRALYYHVSQLFLILQTQLTPKSDAVARHWGFDPHSFPPEGAQDNSKAKSAVASPTNVPAATPRQTLLNPLSIVGPQANDSSHEFPQALASSAESHGGSPFAAQLTPQLPLGQLSPGAAEVSGSPTTVPFYSPFEAISASKPVEPELPSVEVVDADPSLSLRRAASSCSAEDAKPKPLSRSIVSSAAVLKQTNIPVQNETRQSDELLSAKNPDISRWATIRKLFSRAGDDEGDEKSVEEPESAEDAKLENFKIALNQARSVLDQIDDWKTATPGPGTSNFPPSAGGLFSPGGGGALSTPGGENAEMMTEAAATDVAGQMTEKYIALAPVLKWVALFGPLVSGVAHDLSSILECIAEVLSTQVWQPKIYEMLAEAEDSLVCLVSTRRDWWRTSEGVCRAIVHALKQKDDSPNTDCARRKLEEQFCLPWLGLPCDLYSRLPPAVKDELWVGFENMQDRQSATLRIAVALFVRLKSYARHVERYLVLQVPYKQTAAVLARWTAELQEQRRVDARQSSIVKLLL